MRVIGHNNYNINEFGFVFNTKENRPLKNILGKNGYYVIGLNRKCLYIHRLLAIHFIPNPENKRTVNHKNGIKTDNRIGNLEWATDTENNQHAYDTGLKKGTQRFKKVIDASNGTIYNSLIDACSAFGMKDYNLTRMLKGTRKNKTNLKYYESK